MTQRAGSVVGRDMRLLRRLAREARPLRGHIAGVLGLSLMGIPLALLLPVPLAIAVDSVLGSHEVPAAMETLLPDSILESGNSLLLVTVALLVVIFLLRLVQEGAYEILRTYTGERLALRFRSRLFRHAQRLSLTYHDERGTTDSTYRIQYDGSAVQYVAVDAVISFVTALLTLVVTIALILTIDWQLALIALAAIPLLVIVARVYRSRLRGHWHVAKELESSAMAVVQETFGAMRVVKAFGQEHREHDRFFDRSSETLRARMRLAWEESAYHLLMGLILAVDFATVMYVGVRHVESGVITLGELLLAVAYLTMLFEPLRVTTRQAASLQASLASAERAYAVLDELPDVEERPDARPIERAGGLLAFKGVTFGYTAGRAALRGVTFELPLGARLGIVGATGAGKTTLTSLLMRFYEPDEGQVLLDRIDVREYRLADLRDQFAVVLQDPLLFSVSIAENIAYAHPDASRDDVVAAARAAGADEFISALPQGYDTPVGERGVQLSGGERQRISLARAFLKDAPILILDEPTSAVDLATEARIIESMDRLMQGRTSIVIAHRPSTLEHCDAQLHIEDGAIVAASGVVRADVVTEYV